MKRTTILDTHQLSARLRDRSINLIDRQLLITRFTDTPQEKDLTIPPNCAGVGRIRHFRRCTSIGWPQNPLPIDPACRALGLARTDLMRAQAFQNAACNWRCWYCFVPFSLLAANPQYAEWITPAMLIDRYLDQAEPPNVIDLTGGQPDLIPEWIPWMMRELRERGLEERVYLWSDDNLSNDYFWRYLTDVDRTFIAEYKNYGRVCCFKGFNADSFTFNTCVEAQFFDQQFSLMARLIKTGMDLYAYATFTTPSTQNIRDDMARFVDRLQALDENLPLRTVPLEIQIYTPVAPRMTDHHNEALRNQWLAIDAWQCELEQRFSHLERTANIADVLLRGHNQ